MAVQLSNQLGARITGLEERLNTCLTEIRSAGEASLSGEAQRKVSLEEGLKKLKQQHAKDLEAHEAQGTQAREQQSREHRRRVRRVERAYEAVRARVAQERNHLTERARKERKQAEEQIVGEETKELQRLSQDHDTVVADVAQLADKANTLKTRISKMGAALGAYLEVQPGTKPQAVKGDPRPFLQETAQELTDIAVGCKRIDDSFFARWSRKTRSVVAAILLVAAHFGALFLMFQFQAKQQIFNYVYLAGSAAGCSLLFLFVTKAVRTRTSRTVLKLFDRVQMALDRLEVQEQEEKERFWSLSNKLMDHRISTLDALDKKIQQRDHDRVQANAQAMARCRDRHQRLKERLRAQDEKQRADLERAHAVNLNRIEQAHEAALARLRGETESNKVQATTSSQQTVRRARQEWTQGFEELERFAQEAMRASLARQPGWDETLQLAFPKDYPEDIRIGTAEIALNKLAVPDDDELKPPGKTVALPMALAFPQCGSLVVQAGGERRDEALSILFNAALRVLSSFPPGMAKLTVLDPVGLGQAFSALMQLADHDEALIGGRIWSDAGHLEKRLAEKTEHIEGVIQNYLRNRYATLGEYNRDAGELKEAYQFLLISDFPNGMSDLALERLASIVSSGAPCGVHLLMYHDARQRWPAQVDLGLLKRNGLVIKENASGFTPDYDGLDRGRFVPEKPPAIEEVNRLLDRAGKAAVEAKRVELSFATAAPKPEEVWSRNTRTGVKLPIGRCGAVRLQEMELGKGTAQHALIAGRTGSGKSTLFHVMITNAAMWFSPHELEFYLIDFKKGVEFKPYATHGLPHARVIAIESDREFGLSVLKRLDRELDRRGEMFRSAGVQDLATYRKNHPDEVLPRTLLLIDEFQEFFTEDDGVSQEAALLLDRFVRQGRAFGLHIILGSQTLSGVYTLAKSTLGQMGVRIALQCNESDSYLILSEDNAAARLLGRPGEAIYNDMSGLVEGNVPFQIVWLSGEQEAEYLKQIARKSRETSVTGAGAVVFEGNAPARLEQNALLQARLEEKPAEAPSTLSVWLGEPNAIKDPTEARFTNAGGSHLLMIGARKDAVLGMTHSIAVSLAALLGPEKLRLLLLDGSADDEFAQHLAKLAAALPHEATVVPHREVPDAIAQLDAQVKTGQEDRAAPERHSFLFVLGLQRFKALRQEDDFAFSSASEEGADTGKAFGNILRDGPEQHVHTIVWCDTLANANRALSRRTLKEFDQRVLFQMSAADSSELIDSPAANKLGLHGAMLFVESDGILEKFRPYALPDEAWLQGLAATLGARFPQGAKSGT